MCVYLYVCVLTCFVHKKQIYPSSNEHTMSLDFDLYSPFPTVMNQSSSEKWLLPGLGQGRSNMSLEHFVMPKRKEMLKKKKKRGREGDHVT